MAPVLPSQLTLDQGLAAVIAAAVSAIVSLVVVSLTLRSQARLQRAQINQASAEFQEDLRLQHERFEEEKDQFLKKQSLEELKSELEWARTFEENTHKMQSLKTWTPSPTEAVGPSDDSSPGSPYIFGPPINNPANFYGRSKTIQEFFRFLRANATPSLMILGARRSGKTSFLYHIIRSGIWQVGLPGDHMRMLPVYINPQRLHFKSPESFWRLVLASIVRALELRLPDYPRSPDMPPVVSSEDAFDFCKDLSARGWHVVLLLDEYECLADHEAFGNEFYYNLRALAQDKGTSWVTASYRDLRQMSQGTGQVDVSPFSNIFHPEPLYLCAMEWAEAKQLINDPAQRAGSPFDLGNDAFLLKMAGPLPYALQVASDCLYTLRLDGLSGTEAQKKTWALFMARMEDRFARYWDHFFPEERAALSQLARGNQIRETDAKSLSNLALYGFVETQGDRFAILGGAFEQWVRQRSES